MKATASAWIRRKRATCSAWNRFRLGRRGGKGAPEQSGAFYFLEDGKTDTLKTPGCGNQGNSGTVGGAFFAGGMRAKDAGEDFVDVAELALQVEGVLELLGREEFSDTGVFGDAIAKT